jgi:hypothetical protein
MPKAAALAFDVAVATVCGLWAGDKLSDILLEHSPAIRALNKSVRGEASSATSFQVQWRRKRDE